MKIVLPRRTITRSRTRKVVFTSKPPSRISFAKSGTTNLARKGLVIKQVSGGKQANFKRADGGKLKPSTVRALSGVRPTLAQLKRKERSKLRSNTLAQKTSLGSERRKSTGSFGVKATRTTQPPTRRTIADAQARKNPKFIIEKTRIGARGRATKKEAIVIGTRDGKRVIVRGKIVRVVAKQPRETFSTRSIGLKDKKKKAVKILTKRQKARKKRANPKGSAVTRFRGKRIVVTDRGSEVSAERKFRRSNDNPDDDNFIPFDIVPKITRVGARPIGKARGKTFKKTRARIGTATTAKRIRRLDLRRAKQREFGSDFNIFQVATRRKTPLRRQRNRDVRAGSDFNVLNLF